MKFLILIEKSNENFSAYAPDLPGCVAAGETKDQTIELMKEAIENHIRLMKESHQEIPEPVTDSAILEVAI